MNRSKEKCFNIYFLSYVFHDQNICILNVLNPEYSCVYFFTYLTCFLEVSDDLIKNLEDCKRRENMKDNIKIQLGRSQEVHTLMNANAKFSARWS